MLPRIKCDRCGEDKPVGGYSVRYNKNLCPTCWELFIKMVTRWYDEEIEFFGINVAKKETTMEVEPT